MKLIAPSYLFSSSFVVIKSFHQYIKSLQSLNSFDNYRACYALQSYLPLNKFKQYAIG